MGGGNPARKRARKAENEATRAEGAKAFRDGKSRESNPHHYCNKDQWWRGYDWEQMLHEQREDELATRAVEEQMLARREADFKAGWQAALSWSHDIRAGRGVRLPSSTVPLHDAWSAYSEKM